MKKILKTILSFAVVSLLVVVGMICLSDLTERKESKIKFGEFYEQEEDFDVLFFGSSHVLNGIFPMELWNEYGIVSYNMAGHGNRMPTNYWVFKNALEYTTPKLVVIDCCLVSLMDKISSEEQLHISTDHIPFSRTKVEMIRDLVEDEERQWDFLWKFSTYHNRWSDLNTEDFDFEYSVERGAEPNIAVALPAEMIILDDSNKMKEENIGIEYLRKMVEECQKQDIEVLLTYIPFPDDVGWVVESNSISDIAEEYDVNYLDYHTLREQVNFNTDCADKNSHLNPSGARKITEYIGNYICTEYDIEDNRENDVYNEWHEAYERYTNDKYNSIRNVESIQNYLMLLKDKNLSYGIYFNENFNWDIYPMVKELLVNIGIDPIQVMEKGKCFVMADNINQTQSMITMLESMQTRFGDFSFVSNENGEVELVCKDEKRINVTHNDIVAIVIDNRTLEIIDTGVFEIDEAKANIIRERD